MKAALMNPIRPSVRLPSTPISAICAGTLLLAGGCGNSPKVSGPRTQSPETLTMADFIAPDATASQRPEQGDSISAPPTAAPVAEREPMNLRDDDITLSSSVSSENPAARPVEIPNPTDTANPGAGDAEVSASAESRTPTRNLQLLDAKVGDVNGKPIFTSSFFEPIEARLIAEAERLPAGEWRASAGRIMSQRLDGIIADELLRAEALAALTPTQRVGLQAFLSNFRNNLLSENLGSSQLAEQRLRENQGITLDEAMRQKEVDTLVQLTLIREINRRVNVSWRDIKQRYERDIDEFSPPPTAVLVVIRAFKDEAEKVDAIRSRLDAGEAFADIAASELNNYNTEQQGVQRVRLEGSFEETQFFGPDALNDATRGLSLGEWTGPIELGSSVYWIQLSDLEQESVSLYDAQLQIQRDLTLERREQAREQYFERLQERARVSTRDEVLIRLFEIAEQRYAPRP